VVDILDQTILANVNIFIVISFKIELSLAEDILTSYGEIKTCLQIARKKFLVKQN